METNNGKTAGKTEMTNKEFLAIANLACDIIQNPLDSKIAAHQIIEMLRQQSSFCFENSATGDHVASIAGRCTLCGRQVIG
jgi:hypothetical protein